MIIIYIYAECLLNELHLFFLHIGADEFVTSLMEAEKLNIPVILGDAPQNDTLNSLKDIVSFEIFNPVKVFEESLFLVSYMLSVYMHRCICKCMSLWGA